MYEKQKSFLIRAAYLAAVAAVIWAAARYLLAWVLPFLPALALAALAEPVMERVRRRTHLKRSFLAAVFTLVLVGTLTAGTVTAARQLARQADEAARQLPGLLAGLPALFARILGRLDEFCAACPAELRREIEAFAARLPEQISSAVLSLSAAVMRWMGSMASALPRTVLFLVTTALAVFFTLSGYPAVAAFARRQLTEKQRRWVRGLRQTLFSTLGKWLRSQAILLGITFCELLAGFALLRVRYAVLLALLVAVIDALPVLGTGTVLLPWAAVLFLAGNVPRGLALTALYAVIAVVRSVTEPKIVAAQAGLPPLAALAAMYVGFRTMGVGGMVGLPVALLVVKQLHDAGYVRIWR
ncbi:MAG: sporulation integral membrane protein YtvI [Oscillospiraceae bacterium]|nr:sporulation integral membrane protein YtvI [Oscillospiraceae bacterium]